MRPPKQRLLSLAIAACAIATAVPANSAEYHWTPVGPNSWPAPGNWTPTRTTPAATDRLVFDSGLTVQATGVPTETIAQLVVSNGTKITLNASGGGSVLTIAGDVGPDLEITGGSTLSLAGANALLINLGTGATGAVGGTLTALGGAHRLQALDADAISFTSGGSAVGSLGFTGNMFGTGSGASALNSVRFKAGSAYVQLEGGSPFGVGQPSSVIIYEPGSLFRLDGTLIPSMSGRTFANFEYNGAGTIRIPGTSPCTIDSLVINSGLFAIELTGGLNLRGSTRVRGSGVLRLGPLTGTTTYTMNGAAGQTLTDSSSVNPGIVFQPSVKLSIDNPAGVRYVRRALTIPGQLEFVHGVVTGFVVLGSTGSTLGGSASTGWVRGNISAAVTPGNPNRSFPLGTDLAYLPVDLSVHGVNKTFTAIATSGSSLGIPAAYYTGSQLDTLQDANYFSSLDLEDSTAWTSFDAVLGFSAPDIDPGADPNAFVVRCKSFRFFDPGPNLLTWHSVTTSTRTASSIDALGVTRDATGDQRFQFLVGEPIIISVSVLDSARVEQTGPTMPLRFRVVLSEPAIDPVAVDYTTASGSALAGSDFGTTLGTLSFAPGSTTLYVPVPIIGDAGPEADETFSLVLANPFRAILDRATATGTILDDDDVTPPSVTVLAPNGGELILEGANVDLEWLATDNVVVNAVDLFLSRDDGATYEPIAAGLPNTGSFAWIATAPLTQLARFKAIAADHRSQTGEDASDAAWAISVATGVEPVIPVAFAFDLASANPSRGTSRIRYALPRDQHVRLAIMDVRGRVVAVLKNDDEVAGTHEVVWEGRTGGGTAPAGIYFVSFQSEDWSAQRRIVRLR